MVYLFVKWHLLDPSLKSGQPCFNFRLKYMAHPIEYSVIRVQNADTLGNFIIQISCTANITFIYTFNIYLCFVHYLIFALIALYSFEAAVPQKSKIDPLSKNPQYRISENKHLWLRSETYSFFISLIFKLAKTPWSKVGRRSMCHTTQDLGKI